MNNIIKRARLILVFLLVYTLLSSTWQTYNQVLGNNFQLYNYSYKSSAGEPYVYPGSKYITLTIDVLYSGTQRIFVYGACLVLPPGFSPSRGYSLCTSAILSNGSSAYVVHPGSILSFRYLIDVAENVASGDYAILIRIRYGDGINTYEDSISGVMISVSSHPPLNLEIVDWWWSPDAYPGSEEVYLYVTFRNRANAYIIKGDGVLVLPQEIFMPSGIRFSIDGLAQNFSTTIALGPISIYPYAFPGTYTVTVSMNATMRTDDNIIYIKNSMLMFNVTVNPAPTINIKVIDYGFVDVRATQGLVKSRFYVTLLNQDFATIRSMVAYFTIIEGGMFINASTTSIYIHRAILSYGDSCTLFSGHILVGQASTAVTIEVKLILFGDRNGAEFWSTQKFILKVLIDRPKVNLGIAKAYWDGDKVYPGTREATLIIVLENLDVVDIRNAVITVRLPSEIFYPETLTVSNILIPSGNRALVRFSPISISPKAKAGTYIIMLAVSAIVFTPTDSFFSTAFTLSSAINIDKPLEESVIDVIGYGWATGKAYTSMVNTGIDVYLRISSPFYSVTNPTISVYLPPGMVFNDNSRSKAIVLEGRYEYGQTIFVPVQDINIYTTDAGIYPIAIELTYLAIDSNGKEFWRRENQVFMLTVSKPSLNMSVIDAGWVNEVVTGFTRGATLYVTFQSLSLDAVKTVIVSIESSRPRLTRPQSNNIISIVSQVLGYGDVVTIRFDDLELSCSNCSKVEIVMTVSAVKIVNQAYYTVKEQIVASVPIVTNIKMFNIVTISTYYEASPAPLLPTARGLRINIIIANTGPYDVVWIKPTVNISGTAISKLNSIEGSCISGVQRGGTCNIVLNVDIISNAKSDVYMIPIELEYGIYNDNAISISREVMRIPIAISDYNYYKPVLRPLTWYWGVQTPIRVYPSQKGVPLTIVIVNDGIYPVEGIEVYLRSRDGMTEIVLDKAQCATVLMPNDYCLALFNVDINKRTGGEVVFDVMIRYVFTMFGTNISNTVFYTISLNVDEYAAGKGLKLIDCSWSNRWPAYPGTENATYVIRFYNSWPYRVSGIIARLVLPKGFSSKGGDTAVTYVSGPIPSLQQVEMVFEVTIDKNVNPGRYKTRLEVEYVVESGPPHILVEEFFEVYLYVHDVNESVLLIYTRWMFSAPEPKTYGALLVVGIRNNYVPIIKGAVLELYTNGQILLSDTNMSHGIIPATRTSPEALQNAIQYLHLSSYLPTQIYEYINQIIRGDRREFGQGDMLYFYIRLNILVDNPGTYIINSYINFIDQWNNVRRVPIKIPIYVLGAARIINVEPVHPILIVNGTANLTITIYNIGSAPIYNVYVYVVPQTHILIPSGGPRYLDIVHPGTPTHISFTLVYNPVSLFAGMATQYIRYTTAIFIIGIIYRDATGSTRYLNVSLAVPIEPFVELRVQSLKSSLANNILTVSGIVINYGLATARSIEVTIIDDSGRILGSSFLGDLDPASQYAFRVEAKVDKKTLPYTLRVVYRDEYNIVRYIDTTIASIQEFQPEKTTPPSSTLEHGISFYQMMIIALVALFLTLMGITMYKYMSRYAHRLKEKIEV